MLTYWNNDKKSKYCLDIGHTFAHINYHGSLHLQTGIYHGQGFLIDSKNSYSYTGNFNCGMRHKFGKMQTDTYTYIGEWASNKRHGLGFYYTKTGHYLGYWENEKRSGLGVSLTTSLEIWAEWVDNSPSGVCLIRKKGSKQFRCASFEGKTIRYLETDPRTEMHKYA